MSLALIQESAKEVRRLAIAGSPLAVGDFRLKKLAAPLEQAGAKVPVFAQVAKAINDVVNGKEADSAANLLNLSTLLNATLYTQGQSSAEGEMRELETFASNSASTRTPARLLKPLVQALTSTGSGRFEIVKSAVERGAFNDLRLIDPAIQALGDVYPELADLVAERILPGYGPGIVPLLKSGLDLKGKKQDARKLQIMHQLDPEGTLPLCKTALDDGSPEVKAAAITCLGKHEDCLPLVLEQANAKNKQLRAAALEALAGHDRPEVTKLFADAIKGKTLDILVGPFRMLRNTTVVTALMDEGKRVFDALVANDSDQIERFCEILACLESRKETAVEDFLCSCFDRSPKLAKLKAGKNRYVDGGDIIERLTHALYRIGSNKTLETILAQRDKIQDREFSYVLRSALRVWSAEAVFKEFSPLLAQKTAGAKQRRDELIHLIYVFHWDEDSRFSPMFAEDEPDTESARAIKKATWDERWLDAAIKADADNIVFALARPGHKAALEYLLKWNDAKRTSDAGSVIRALVRCQYPKVTDYFIELIKSKTKGGKYNASELSFLLENARHLPPSDLPKLDAFATKLEEKLVDHFLEAIAPLRATSQPNQSL